MTSDQEAVACISSETFSESWQSSRLRLARQNWPCVSALRQVTPSFEGLMLKSYLSQLRLGMSLLMRLD